MLSIAYVVVKFFKKKDDERLNFHLCFIKQTFPEYLRQKVDSSVRPVLQLVTMDGLPLGVREHHKVEPMVLYQMVVEVQRVQDQRTVLMVWQIPAVVVEVPKQLQRLEVATAVVVWL